jgi:hypothetical protein
MPVERNNTTLIFQSELGLGERLLWSALQPADALLIPFSLAWTGLVLVWEYLAVTSGAPFCFALWGVPFVLMGLYMILGRFFVDAHRRSQTHYALTSKRIIILSGQRNSNVETLDLQRLSRIHLTSRKDGRGTITFGSAPPGMWWQATRNWLPFVRDTTPVFESIENTRAVYEQILRARENLLPEDEAAGHQTQV